MASSKGQRLKQHTNTTVLAGLPDEIVKAAMPEITEVLVESSVANAPLGPTGNLKRSIRARRSQDGRQVWISGYGKRGNHAHLVISGTRKHYTPLNKHKAYKFAGGEFARVKAGGALKHPGAHKRTPFYDLALAETAPQVDWILDHTGDQQVDRAAGEVIT